MNVNFMILLYFQFWNYIRFVSLVTWTTFTPLYSTTKISEYSMIQIIQLFVPGTGRGELVFLFLQATINVVCAHQINSDLICTVSLDESVVLSRWMKGHDSSTCWLFFHPTFPLISGVNDPQTKLRRRSEPKVSYLPLNILIYLLIFKQSAD